MPSTNDICRRTLSTPAGALALLAAARETLLGQGCVSGRCAGSVVSWYSCMSCVSAPSRQLYDDQPSHSLARRLRGPFLFFFNDTATTEIYTLSLHDALPISSSTAT